MQGTLIKISKNGNKHYRGMVACDRCGGAGGADKWAFTGYTCYKCGGSGKVEGTWIEYSPEYEAKMTAKREAQQKKWEEEEAQRLAELEVKRAEEEAQHKAEEEAEKARKAISQYVGAVGDKLNLKVRFDHTAYWEQPSFSGYGTETMHLHCFRDEAGNLLVWKTTKSLGWLQDNGEWLVPEENDELILKGTIKEHKEYNDEKQTVLQRCKVERV